MSQYLPFGKKIVPTQEQIEKQTLIYKRYDFYGLPYGHFDASEEADVYSTQKAVDREKARLLILEGKAIPKELEAKLLEYKKQESVV